MKKFKIIIILIVISVILQNCILYYFNNYYFATVSTIKYKKVSINTASIADNTKEYSIPREANDVKSSFSGDYLLYNINQQYYVLNLNTKETSKINFEASTKNSYVSWNYYNDKVMVIENDGNYFKVYNYYPDKKTKEIVLDINAKSEVYKLPQNDDKITDLKINNLNTNIYITSTKGNSSFRHLSRLDITGGVVKINALTNNIRNYYLYKQDDNILLQDSMNNKINLINGNKTSIIDTKTILNPILLSIDKNGILYIGEKNNDKIQNIYVTDLTKKDEKSGLLYTKKILKEPVEEDDIHITDDGKMIINNKLKGVLTNLSNGMTYKYKGILICFYKEGIFSSINNKLIKQNIKY